MNTGLNIIQNYDMLSLDCLLIMLKSFDRVYIEDKKPVVLSITKKYFENKTSVNIYSLILRDIKFRNLEDTLNYVLFVLGKELEGNVKDLPKEYREDFFKVLIYFLNSVEEYTKKNKNSVEWQLSNIPKLLDYLGEIENNDITSYSLRQQINSLVLKIREDFENTKKVQLESNSLIVINQMTEKETQEKLDKIKVLKLKKSNLTKSKLMGALSSFDLYSEEDKKYLFDYMFKHNWTDCVNDMNQVSVFRFLREHSNYAILHERYNPLKVLRGAFYKLLKTYSSSLYNSWLEYFNVTDIDEMIIEIEKWYKSLKGSTELGWFCYKKDLFSAFFEGSGGFVSNDICREDNELQVYAQKMLIEDCDKYLTYFDSYWSKNIRKWFEKVNKIEEICFEGVPSFTVNGIVEDIKVVNKEEYLISYYWEIFKKYDDKLFNYHGNTVEKSKIEILRLAEEKTQIIENFINVLNSVYFNGEDLVYLKNTVKWNRGYSSWSDKNNIKADAINLIIRYFCQNYKGVTNDLIKDLWYDKEHYSAFLFFTDYHIFTGLFTGPNDYSLFFFERLKNELDFSNKLDLEKVLYLNSNINNRGKFFSLFYEKLKIECPDSYTIINNFIKGKTENFERDIVNFIKAYYLIV